MRELFATSVSYLQLLSIYCYNSHINQRQKAAIMLIRNFNHYERL